VTTAAEKRYMGAVASIPCVACGAEGVHVHHMRFGAGMGQKNSPFLTIALCPGCHQGELSIHSSKKQFEAIFGNELHLLAKTIEGVFNA